MLFTLFLLRNGWQAAKRAARQQKFGFVDPAEEKKALAVKLTAEQEAKKAQRIARFGEISTPRTNPTAPSSTVPKASAKPGRVGGGSKSGKAGGAVRGRGVGKGRGGERGRGDGGRKQGGQQGKRGQVSATTMLAQGLKSSR